jgi:hypothetical protein
MPEMFSLNSSSTSTKTLSSGTRASSFVMNPTTGDVTISGSMSRLSSGVVAPSSVVAPSIQSSVLPTLTLRQNIQSEADRKVQAHGPASIPNIPIPRDTIVPPFRRHPVERDVPPPGYLPEPLPPTQEQIQPVATEPETYFPWWWLPIAALATHILMKKKG